MKLFLRHISFIHKLVFYYVCLCVFPPDRIQSATICRYIIGSCVCRMRVRANQVGGCWIPTQNQVIIQLTTQRVVNDGVGLHPTWMGKSRMTFDLEAVLKPNHIQIGWKTWDFHHLTGALGSLKSFVFGRKPIYYYLIGGVLDSLNPMPLCNDCAIINYEIKECNAHLILVPKKVHKLLAKIIKCSHESSPHTFWWISLKFDCSEQFALRYLSSAFSYTPST